MIRVGLVVEESTKLLIKSSLSNNFIELRKDRSSTDKVDVLVIDGSLTLDEYVDCYGSISKVIVLFERSCVEVVRYLISRNKLFDLILKRDYLKLEDIFSKLSNINAKHLLIDNGNSITLVLKEDILYISYDRIGRKSILTTKLGEYQSKSSLGDLEKILSNRFLKAERGLILNRNEVLSINFKDEKLIFKNMLELSVGKRTLKKISEDVFCGVIVTKV